MQKLTYSGNACNNYVYFSFDGDYFDVAIITKELKIEPTSIRLKKDPIPKSTSWKLQIDVGSETDLASPTEDIIKQLEPKIDEIVKLKKDLNLETRLQFVIDIDINPESSTPYFPLKKRIIKFLNQTETEVDFDIYKADTVGLFKNE
jgi:hypothetical protein